MSKKNLLPTLYPLSRGLSSKWFIQYWTTTTPPKRLKQRIPDYPDLTSRLNAANAFIESLKKNPAPSPKADIVIYTEKLKLAYALFQSRRSAIQKRTYESYNSHFMNLNRFLKERNVRTLNNEVALQFLDYLNTEGYHPKTINSHRVTFNVHFNKLVKKKIIRSNPFDDCEVIKCESECPHYYKSNQIAQLKKYMLQEKPQLWSAVRWVFYQFLRPDELRNLQIADIDFDDWKIKVKATTAKNSRSVWLPIVDGLKAEIQKLCLYQYPQNYYVIGLDGLPNEQKVSTNYWRYHHKIMLEKFGLNTDNYKMYGWKHTGFVLAYKAGVGIVELKLLARHASIEETYNYMRRVGLIDFPDVRSKFPSI